MNYLVSLHKKGSNTYGEVVVDRVLYQDMSDDYWVKLEGTDPYCYPEFVQDVDDLTWFSKNLTLMLKTSDPIDVVSVATTDDPIPEPNVHL